MMPPAVADFDRRCPFVASTAAEKRAQVPIGDPEDDETHDEEDEEDEEDDEDEEPWRLDSGLRSVAIAS